MKKKLKLKKKTSSGSTELRLLPSFLISAKPDPQDLRNYVAAHRERKRLDGEISVRKNT